MNLSVELAVEMVPGKGPHWVAHTNRFHFPGFNGTAIGEGGTPGEALTALAQDLDRIAQGAIAEPERLSADLLRTEAPSPQRPHTHEAVTHDVESDRVFCACGAWRLGDSQHWSDQP